MKKNIFDYLKYLDKRIFKGHALYIHLSFLPKEDGSKILSLFSIKEIQTFLLTNGDFVVFFNNNKIQNMMLLSLKIKSLIFSDLNKTLIEFFNLSKDYSSFYETVVKIENPTKSITELKILKQLPRLQLDYIELQKIIYQLKNTDIGHLIQQQPICFLNPSKGLDFLYISLFISFFNLRHVLNTQVNFDSNLSLKEGIEDILKEKIFLKLHSSHFKKPPIFPISFDILFQKEFFSKYPILQTGLIELNLSNFLSLNEEEFSHLKENIDLKERLVLNLDVCPSFIFYDKIPVKYYKISADSLEVIEKFSLPKDKIIFYNINDEKTFNFILKQGYSLMQGQFISQEIYSDKKNFL